MVIQLGEGTVVGRSVWENDSDSEEMPKKDQRERAADIWGTLNLVEMTLNSRPLSYVSSLHTQI